MDIDIEVCVLRGHRIDIQGTKDMLLLTEQLQFHCIRDSAVGVVIAVPDTIL
jgi:hypothetical protein